MRLLRILFLAPALPFAFLSGSALAQPQLPSTVYGSASIDGKPVPDGTEVRGYIDGRDCTQASGLRGTVTEGGASAFVINVMHETQRAGCGQEGKTITFTIKGQQAPQSTAWKVGIQRFDLNIGAGQPPPLPSEFANSAGATAVPATPAAVPTGPPPTDDVTFNRASPPLANPTPGPSVAAEPEGGAPVGVILLVAVLILASVGFVAGLVLSRRAK